MPTTSPPTPRVVEPRVQGHEYHVEHHDGPAGSRLFVLTNADGAENFALMVTPLDSPARANWTTVLAHRPEVRLDDVDAFAGHLVVSERADGPRAPAGVASGRRRRRRRRSRDPARRARVLDVDRREPRVRDDDAPLRVHVVGDAGVVVRLRRRRPGGLAREAPAGRSGTTLRSTSPNGSGRRASDGTRVPISVVYAPRPPRRRRQPVAPLRLRLVRALDRPELLVGAGEPPRPRRGLRDRARSRRRRARAPVVRRRQADAQAQHVHRLRRLRRAPRRRGLDRSRAGSRRAAAAPAGC